MIADNRQSIISETNEGIADLEMDNVETFFIYINVVNNLVEGFD